MDELLQFEKHLEAAHQMVSDLCLRKREWIMSIPAQPDYDPDLVIGQALRDSEKMLKRLKELEKPEPVSDCFHVWLATTQDGVTAVCTKCGMKVTRTPIADR